MNELDWDELRLFHVVAETGSLAAASQRTGISSPTIGRRMASLEKATGRKLFIRHQTGYELAVDGHALYEKVRDMQRSAGDIEQWASGAYQLPNVTISAGTWTTRFLGHNLPALWTARDEFTLCFKTSEAHLDFGHREADIGIRNSRPTAGNLAARKAVPVAFAPYCHRDFDPERNRNWVSVGRETGTTPSSHWVHSRADLWITIWVSTPVALLDMLKGGGGQGVLPCFVGDTEPALRRSGPMIGELEHMSWIVMHDDERHDPMKRLVIDRLSHMLRSNADLFAGKGAKHD
ncbi:MAG: LysR family transcriptional regulator [Pseudomonadota bacterium]